jgi:hypothetical protein
MTDHSTPRYTAGDVAGLRRELADWYGGPQGRQMYYNAIVMGHQALRPAGTPERAAAELAATETRRLREANLWYVDQDLCALLNAAHPSMPPFAPRPQDLPAQVGFVVFAEPIAIYPASVAHSTDLTDAMADTFPDGGDSFRAISDKLAQDHPEIIAVSWGPVDNPHWSAGGLWMSFYAASQDIGEILTDPAEARRARAMLPPLTVDNEAALAWRPDGTPVDGYQLSVNMHTSGTIGWARLVFAAFQLAAQANLADTDPLATPRPERRRTDRAGLPPRDVRIIRLRRGIAQAAGDTSEPGTGRDWRHRWIVRGHWRNQWYPSPHRPPARLDRTPPQRPHRRTPPRRRQGHPCHQPITKRLTNYSSGIVVFAAHHRCVASC